MVRRRAAPPRDEARASSARVSAGERVTAADVARKPDVCWPLVRAHPDTGRKALYVNEGFTKRIVELSRTESRAVLAQLFEHVQDVNFQCRFHWQANSVALWDNRCTQHYAVPDYHERRVLHRVAIEGTVLEPAQA